MLRVLYMAIIIGFLNASEYDDESDTADELVDRSSTEQEFHDDPVTPENLSNVSIAALMRKQINCERFSSYALNCTITAALMYNSSRKAPPVPAKMSEWCGAIKYLTECAQDWNTDCKDVTESSFNEESIKGHQHVVTSICDNENFLARYDSVSECIESIRDGWEVCYSKFKSIVDDHKNQSREWTHYETHFLLCCARAHFRRCTLNLLFNHTKTCPQKHTLTLQKFSVIVSEGDVYQDCDHNIMYKNCPGSDPRPSGVELTEFLDPKFFPQEQDSSRLLSASSILRLMYIVLFIFL